MKLIDFRTHLIIVVEGIDKFLYVMMKCDIVAIVMLGIQLQSAMFHDFMLLKHRYTMHTLNISHSNCSFTNFR